ncbi:MAG: hypothetical protein KJ043_07465, partial [Anaerolineae bacterium]|nr:hypothetical protein [Anaerolineae bacterium]
MSDIFVRDTIANTTTRISVANGSVQANGASERPSMSNDGVYIAFQSVATNLVGGDTNGFSDIFVHNRLDNTTQLVSKNFSGGLTNGNSDYPLISGDGSYILFSSSATNIVDDPFHGNTYFVNALTSQFIYNDNVSAIDMSASGHVWIFNDYDKDIYDEDAFYDVTALNLHLPGKLPAPTLIAPANAFSTTNFNVNFSWNAVPDATQYQIQIATDSGFTNIVHDHILAGTTYNYALSNSGTYYWRVRALNTIKFGLWSASRQFTIQPLPAPTLIAPADMLVTTDTNLTFSWNSVSGATQYQIQIATDSGFTNIIHNHTLASTSYNYTLPGQGRYYWRVRANGGTWSSVRYFDIPSPFIPLLLTPDNLAIVGNSVDFSWSPVVNATEYQIQISTSNTFSSTLLNQTITGTSYNYIFTQSGTRYWRVRARVSGTFQNWSEVRQLDVQLVNTPSLIAPSNQFKASDLNIAFSWSSVTGATGYDIQIATDSAFTNVVHNHSLSATSYNYTLPQARTYYWRVRAKINTRIGAWTSSRQFTIAPTLNAPITMTLAENPTVNFSWFAMTGVSQYQIQISRNSQFTQIENDQIVMTNSHTFELPYFSAYYWRVRVADNPDGVWSDVWRVNYDTTPHYIEGDIRHLLTTGSRAIFKTNLDTFYLASQTSTAEYDIFGNQVRSVAGPIYVPDMLNDPFLIDISRDGRYVLYNVSIITQRTPTLTWIYQTFIYDSVTDSIIPIMQDALYTFGQSISEDGRYVSISTLKSLSPQDTDDDYDVYVYDRQTNQFTFASPNIITTNFGGAAWSVFSPDSRFVAYIHADSIPSYWSPFNFDSGSLYVYNMQTGQNTRITTPNGTTINAHKVMRFSQDGRYLLFASFTDFIVPTDNNISYDVFLYDLQTDEFTLISLSLNGNGEPANGDSYIGSISADNRFVTFTSGSNLIVPGDTSVFDVFIYDRQTAITTKISQTINNDIANGTSGYVSDAFETGTSWIFQNNRFVVFHSNASNLSPIDPNFNPDMLLAVRRPTIIPADIPDIYTPTGFAISNANITFTWEEIVDATRYDIEIATDPDFNNIIHTGSAIFTSYEYTLPANGTYYWRLRGANNLGNGAWTATSQLILGVGQNGGMDEQQLFNMAQPMFTNGMTFALFDVTPTGIITTTQFDDGGVVTGTIRMTVQNGLLLITVDGLSGGSTAQQNVFRDSMPAMMMNMLDEMLPDGYLAIEAVTM